LNQIKKFFESMHKEMGDRSSKGSGKSKRGKSGKSGKHSIKDDKGGPGGEMKEKMEEMQKKILKIIEPAKEFLNAEQFKKLTEKLTKRPSPPPNGQNDKKFSGQGPEGTGNNSSASCTLKGSYVVSGKTTKINNESYASHEKDTSAIYVKNGGVLTLVNVKVETTGNTSSQENSSFYGLNAGIIVTQNSSANITGGFVNTSGSGANAVFATGPNSKITLTNVKLTATGNGGHGVMATRGGFLTLKNVDIETTRERAGAIATDRGSGTISVTGGTVFTSGKGSPVIYSTGAISAIGLNGEASGSEAAVIEGGNSINLINCTMSGGKPCGAMLYQSFSGDAEGHTGTFTMKGGSLLSRQGPVFYVTNAKGVINLNNAEVKSSTGVLLKATADRWGNEGENGGHAELTATSQILSGDLICDRISSIIATLKTKSILSGKVCGASLSLDEDSKWNVTADSVVKTLEIADGVEGLDRSINSNGHNVQYATDVKGNKWLKGKVYSLPGGGKLLPME